MRTPRACGRGAARVGSGSALSSCGERATRSAVSVARNGRFLRKSIAVHVDDDRRPRVTLTRDLARVSALAPMFGRAFVTEPMMYWPMGTSGDVAARFAGCFASFLAVALPLGLVWEAGQADGVAVWVSPEQREAWDLHPWDQPQILAAAEDGGRRYEAFWEWVARHDPAEPSWQLDTIAVEPDRQGRGIGRALIEAGLARVPADGTGAFLSTGTRGTWRSTVAAASASTMKPTHRTAARVSGSCAGTHERHPSHPCVRSRGHRPMRRRSRPSHWLLDPSGPLAWIDRMSATDRFSGVSTPTSLPSSTTPPDTQRTSSRLPRSRS